MDRRAFLLCVAAGVLSATETACTRAEAARPISSGAPLKITDFVTPPVGPPSAVIIPEEEPYTAPPSPPPPPPFVRPPIPPAAPGPASVLTALPGAGNQIALTIDDGISSEVVGAYVTFAEQSGVRLTFFPNGRNPSWTDHAARIGKLVDSGQVQIGNHTWDHLDLTKQSAGVIASQLERNDQFFRDTWGVSSRPYMRPPYGNRNGATDSVAGSQGYTKVVMWYGSLGDAALLTDDVLMDQARKWLTAQRIVIGHANFPTVTRLYGQILEMLQARNLQTVTLQDVFGR